MPSPIGFTLCMDGGINFEFFLPTEEGLHRAAADFGLSAEDYEVVPLAESLPAS